MTYLQDQQLPADGPPPWAPTPEQKPSWLRRHLAVLIPSVLATVLAVALAVVLIEPFGSEEDSAASATYDIGVTFVLYDYKAFYADCSRGGGGYSDIGPGTQVTIRNGSGDTLGIGSLGAGIPARGQPMANCTYRATITDVAAGENFYAVEVGSRGEISQSEAELKANGFSFEVSLGG
jgi:hypothetical protein